MDIRNQNRAVGQRLQIIGNTCAGKSTMAARLGEALSIPAIDLDAINWQPNWVALTSTDPDEFERRLETAPAGGYSALSNR